MEDESDPAFDALLRRVAKTPIVARERLRVQPGVRLIDRFEIQSALGVGGMGQVFAAFDHQRQSRVALKLLGQLTPHRISLLKREFRTAAEFVHPNLVRLHELFSDASEGFFTMELIEGSVVSERLAVAKDFELHRSIFRQLAVGLEVLHAAGTLHGDLKPSNFLITRDEDRVVLLDFGLSRSSGPAQTLELSGTPRYMAPEQKRAEPLTDAADWYAFGVVLYEVLTGDPLLDEPASETLADAPADLRELCLALLRPIPAQRPRVDEVLMRLGSTSLLARRSKNASERLPLVGRATEMSTLLHAFEVSLSDGPVLALVHGASGIGKTALIDHCIHALRTRGALVLTAKCRERESIAYKAVDGLIDGIVALLDALPHDEATRLLPQCVAELAVLFPQLRLTVAMSQMDSEIATGDQALIRVHAIGAFGELLANLRARSPLVVWLDDLQWSDAESALLLGPLFGGAGRLNMLVIASYRAEVQGRGAMLDALLTDNGLPLPATHEIALGPLDTLDAERMALSVFGANKPDTVAIARHIGREAGGHPLFIRELVHAAEHLGDGREAVPISLVELIQERLDALAQRPRQLLELVAIAGEPSSRELLQRVQGLSPSDAEKAIDSLRANRLLRSQGLKANDTVDIHHDRIREIVVKTLTEKGRQEYHLRLARILEAMPQTRPARLAGHYEAAGQAARAGRYWIAAADQAFSALAFAHAAHLYEKGVALATLGHDELRSIQIRRAEALGLAGRGPAAADVYLLQATTSTREDALELRRRAAEQLLLSGHLARGLQVIEEVLQAVGMRRTLGGRRALLPILLGRVWLRLRGLGHIARKQAELSREQLAQIDAAWTIAWSLGFVDPIRGTEFQTRHLRLALRAGEPQRLLRAVTLEASYSATPGPDAQGRTADLLTLASELARQTEDTTLHSLLAVARGVVAYLQGESARALGHCDEALQQLNASKSGAVWERMSAQRLKIASLFTLGRLRELSQLVPPLVVEIEGSGNLYATASFRTAYSTVAWLVRDEVQEASRQLELARRESQSDRFQLVHCNLLFGDVFRDFYCGDYFGALQRLRTHWPLLQESQLLRVAVLRVQCWQMRGACAAALADQRAARNQTSAAREHRREARDAVRVLLGESLSRARPMARLIQASLELADGRLEIARANLRECVDRFDQLQMQMHSASAQARLAALEPAELAQQLLGAAERAFQGQSVARPARLISLLAPGFGQNAPP